MSWNSRFNKWCAFSCIINTGKINISRIYANITDVKWNYYNGTNWTAGGTYQSTGISDGAVTIPKLGSDVKFNLNSRINDKNLCNIYYKINIDLPDNVANISISSNGTIDGTSQLTRVSKLNMNYIPKNSIIKLNSNTNSYTIEVYFYIKDLSFIDYFNITNTNNLKRYLIPNIYCYCRFKFRLANNNNIAPSVVLWSVNMSFEKYPMFYDSYNNTKGTNLINSSYKTNGYLVGQASTVEPYCFNTTGSYNSYIVPIKVSQEYYINKGNKLTLYDKDLKYINNSYVDSAYTDDTFTILIVML